MHMKIVMSRSVLSALLLLCSVPVLVIAGDEDDVRAAIHALISFEQSDSLVGCSDPYKVDLPEVGSCPSPGAHRLAQSKVLHWPECAVAMTRRVKVSAHNEDEFSREVSWVRQSFVLRAPFKMSFGAQ